MNEQSETGTHVSEETLSHVHRRLLALFQFPQEVLTMKLVDLLHVAEDHVALPPQRLGDVLAHQLRYVILRQERTPLIIRQDQPAPVRTLADSYLYYVLEGLDVVSFGLYHFPHYKQYCSAR